MLGGGGVIAVLVAVMLVSGFFQSVRVFFVKAGAEKQATTTCFTLRIFPLCNGCLLVPTMSGRQGQQVEWELWEGKIVNMQAGSHDDYDLGVATIFSEHKGRLP